MWRSHAGVLVCLLALLSALFAEVETSSAAAAGAEQLEIAIGHIDTSSGGSATVAHNTCMHYGQCSVQAILFASPTVDPHGSNAVSIANCQIGGDRVVSPLRPPPKSPVSLQQPPGLASARNR